MFAAATAGAASLTGTVVGVTGTIDLTADQPDDWVHWALLLPTDINRKAGAAEQITGPLAPIAGGVLEGDGKTRAGYSWTGGTPTATATNTQTGQINRQLGGGIRLTVAAGVAERTLRLYAGIRQGTGTLTVSLSDGSAAPLSFAQAASGGRASREFTLVYAAASDDQQLVIEYVLDTKETSDSSFVSIESAVLFGGGASGPTNQPPALDPIGDQSLIEGDTLTLNLLASDADGPAPMFSYTTDLPGGDNLLLDNLDGTATITWPSMVGDAAATPYSLTVTATDDQGATAAETVLVTVQEQTIVGGGSLIGQAVVRSGTVDLTLEGTTDWAHWGRLGVADVDRKAGVATQIGSAEPLGGATPQPGGGTSARYSWSDGDLAASITKTRTGLKIFNVGRGIRVPVTADTTSRTLKFYVGLKVARARFTAKLDDASAPPFEVVMERTSGKRTYEVELTYAAAGPGAVLLIDWELEALNGSGDAWASLESAALVGGGVNQVPVLSPIGPQTVVEGDTLALALAATDADGPLPLVWSATSDLPGGGTLTDNMRV